MSDSAAKTSPMSGPSCRATLTAADGSCEGLTIDQSEGAEVAADMTAVVPTEGIGGSTIEAGARGAMPCVLVGGEVSPSTLPHQLP